MVMRILEHCMKTGVKVYTHKDGYELGDNIQSKVLAFAFGLAAEIERKMISERTKEGLARVRAEGKILGRPVGRKSAKLKLTDRIDIVRRLLSSGYSQSAAARKLHVHRITLAAFMKNNNLERRKHSTGRFFYANNYAKKNNA
jgi:DNA invertase Pin-like site-specific DNA recombinase